MAAVRNGDENTLVRPCFHAGGTILICLGECVGRSGSAGTRQGAPASPLSSQGQNEAQRAGGGGLTAAAAGPPADCASDLPA